MKRLFLLVLCMSLSAGAHGQGSELDRRAAIDKMKCLSAELEADGKGNAEAFNLTEKQPVPCIGFNAYRATSYEVCAGMDPAFYVHDVQQGSPAETGGLKKGDKIIAINGVTPKHFFDFKVAVLSSRPGEKVGIIYLGDGANKSVTLPMGKATDPWDIDHKCGFGS